MNKNKQFGFTIFELIVALVVVFGLIGWIMNIAKLFYAGLDPVTGKIILRIVGIFLVPLGSIVGYM